MSSERAGERVRVTAPTAPRAPKNSAASAGVPRRTGAAGSRLEDSPPLEEIYVRSLLRAQLRLALRMLGIVAALVTVTPLAFFVRPELAQAAVLGVPVAWALLGVAVYPLMLAIGWRYLRGAERNERDFAELVRRAPR